MAHDPTHRHILHRLLRSGALPFWVLVGLGGGIAGVLVDADHIPGWIFGYRPYFYPFNFLGFHASSHLHSALFLVGLGGLACAGGLLLVMVLKKKF
jgi:hypothetical protein